MAMKIDKTGEQFKTNEGYIIEIIKYNKYSDVLVQFQDEHKAIVPTTVSNCKTGEIKNPYHPNKYGGYLGQGKYNCKIYNKQYRYWMSLLIRGCDNSLRDKLETYKDVVINQEVYNFQNFCEWWENNFYEIEGETMCIDKDILVKGNKEYRFDRMIFAPNRINVLFTKRDSCRGNYPIGVTYHKKNNKYIAKCGILTDNGNSKMKYLGSYNTPKEAFFAYKEFKEQYIKQIADEYKDKIPQRLYDAMYAWEVEIDD